MNAAQRRQFSRAMDRIEATHLAPPKRSKRTHTGAVDYLAHKWLKNRIRRHHDERVAAVEQPPMAVTTALVQPEPVTVSVAKKPGFGQRLMDWLLRHSNRQ